MNAKSTYLPSGVEVEVWASNPDGICLTQKTETNNEIVFLTRDDVRALYDLILPKANP